LGVGLTTPHHKNISLLRKFSRSLGPERIPWINDLKMELRELGRDGMDWIDLAQDRDQWRALVNTVMNLRVP
jgi:hypothetical protein